MLKKVWFIFVLWSVLMVSGCSDGMPKDNTDSVAVSDDVVSDLMICTVPCCHCQPNGRDG